jgi:hypothetical protein
MAYLDLRTLPPALQEALNRRLDNDESRRRAVLAPAAANRCASIWRDGLYAWRSWKHWGNRGAWFRPPGTSAMLRQQDEAFFTTRLDHNRPDSPSIFSPELPFFPCALTDARTVLRSPFPGAFSDAEFWAYTMQACAGDPIRAEQVLRGWADELIGLQQGPFGRWRYALRKPAVLDEMWYRHTMRNEGAYS